MPTNPSSKTQVHLQITASLYLSLSPFVLQKPRLRNPSSSPDYGLSLSLSLPFCSLDYDLSLSLSLCLFFPDYSLSLSLFTLLFSKLRPLSLSLSLSLYLFFFPLSFISRKAHKLMLRNPSSSPNYGHSVLSLSFCSFV